ncbi:glucosaminidase domain-containing protein [Companilactobacillus sp.]|jgi:flagellum-specific peptidoglycan hydrolase FlgJ|uniref:glucosaminidase domain-containing protein n=1 Tax=Companilactobacillus sp. TaxID=2767905 RepID=UPI0025BFD48A|nr:glucosaminidase domain-containing protein [Companilactobacillus sp.]
MRKKLLFTSVAILNTMASVAVPTVVSAATADANTDTNTTEQAVKAQQDTQATNENTQESAAPEISADNENVEMTANNNEQKAEILKGSKSDTPDSNIAHSTDISDLGDDQAMPAPMSRMAPSAFINLAGPMAQRSANRYGVYASVMMAQAIIESGWGGSTLSMAPNYNLFGIKGSYNGQSVYMKTAEYSPSYGWYYINAAFRKYPSYEQSFDDNGALLRYNMGSFYRGTWKENTRSYRDATAWLQGRYATAPNYAAVLNNTIATYNLTRFDSAPQGGNTNAAAEAPLNGTFYDMSDIATISNEKGAQLFEQANPDRPVRGMLSKGTDWEITGKCITKNGEVYYRVSANEYIKASDVSVKSDSLTLNGTWSPVDDIGTITNATGAKVYLQADPNHQSRRTLKTNSDWKIIGKSVAENGQTYYQVSAKEFIKAEDVRLKSVTKVITAQNPDGDVVPLLKFKDNGKAETANRGLANGTDWLTDETREFNGHNYYRVSTNEWVLDSHAKVK